MDEGFTPSWASTLGSSEGGQNEEHPVKVVILNSSKLMGPKHHILGGGFKYFLFSPLFGEDFRQFD